MNANENKLANNIEWEKHMYSTVVMKGCGAVP